MTAEILVLVFVMAVAAAITFGSMWRTARRVDRDYVARHSVRDDEREALARMHARAHHPTARR